MANYYSGTAADYAALKSALIDTCVLEGWSNSSGELSKSGVYVYVDSTSTSLTVLGRSTAGGGAAPRKVSIGNYSHKTGGTYDIVFPCDYEIFIFDQEVYMVVNWSIEYFQWLMFGKSTLSLPGTGGYVAGSRGEGKPYFYIENRATGLYASLQEYITPAFAWMKDANYVNIGGFMNADMNYWVHHNLDGGGWYMQSDSTSLSIGNLPGINPDIAVVAVGGSAFTGESVLLPMRAYVGRPSNQQTLVVDCQYSRRIRIDQYEPKQVITYGSDQWKVYPWLRKSYTYRNGGSEVPIHSGTFGWAIRYIP